MTRVRQLFVVCANRNSFCPPGSEDASPLDGGWVSGSHLSVSRELAKPGRGFCNLCTCVLLQALSSLTGWGVNQTGGFKSACSSVWLPWLSPSSLPPSVRHHRRAQKGAAAASAAVEATGEKGTTMTLVALLAALEEMEAQGD
jgi:hypothetical protein